MAVFTDSTALVSVGMSCQTAEQLRTHESLLTEIIGQDVSVRATPFDWLICPPTEIARMITEDVFAPDDGGDITRVEDKPYWADRRCYFWHEKKALTDFETFKQKLAHVTDTLHRVGRKGRRIFFLSNTQNNLEMLHDELPGVDYFFTDAVVGELRDSLQRRFGDHELHVVTYAGRHSLSRDEGVFELERDDTEWEGPEEQWAEILRKVVAA